MAVGSVQETLREVVKRFDGIDNGHCLLCRSYRYADLKGKVQPCANPECFSHKLTSAIKEVSELRQWVREEGIRTNVCTSHVLGEQCEDCKCLKSDDRFDRSLSEALNSGDGAYRP